MQKTLKIKVSDRSKRVFMDRNHLFLLRSNTKENTLLIPNAEDKCWWRRCCAGRASCIRPLSVCSWQTRRFVFTWTSACSAKGSNHAEQIFIFQERRSSTPLTARRQLQIAHVCPVDYYPNLERAGLRAPPENATLWSSTVVYLLS